MEAFSRFWGKVKKTNGCWDWTASRANGYGLFWFNGQYVKAHRFSWEMHIGRIPKGMLVCHRCDNPGCVNPAHLFLGTQKDNMQDALKKGRTIKMHGEKCGKSKLTEKEVLLIRREYKPYSRNNNLRTLAEKHDTHQANIRDIVKRNTWKHI